MRAPARMRRWRGDTPLCSLTTPVEPEEVTQKREPFRPWTRKKTEFWWACERRESVWVGGLGAGHPGWTGGGDGDDDDYGDDDDGDGAVWLSFVPFHLEAPTGPPDCEPWKERVHGSGSVVGGSSLRYSGYRPVRGDTGVSASSHRTRPAPLHMPPRIADGVSAGLRGDRAAEPRFWPVRRISVRRSSIRFWGA